MFAWGNDGLRGTVLVLAQYGKKSEDKDEPKKLKYTDTFRKMFL